MKESKTQLIIRALLARGYCEGRISGQWASPDVLFQDVRVWAISPTHARRLGKPGDLVWLASQWGRWRLGRSYASAKPLPRAMLCTLQQHGAELADRLVKRLGGASPRSAEELGL